MSSYFVYMLQCTILATNLLQCQSMHTSRHKTVNVNPPKPTVIHPHLHPLSDSTDILPGPHTSGSAVDQKSGAQGSSASEIHKAQKIAKPVNPPFLRASKPVNPPLQKISKPVNPPFQRTNFLTPEYMMKTMSEYLVLLTEKTENVQKLADEADTIMHPHLQTLKEGGKLTEEQLQHIQELREANKKDLESIRKAADSIRDILQHRLSLHHDPDQSSTTIEPNTN